MAAPDAAIIALRMKTMAGGGICGDARVKREDDEKGGDRTARSLRVGEMGNEVRWRFHESGPTPPLIMAALDAAIIA
jgi:hypothetical protein